MKQLFLTTIAVITLIFAGCEKDTKVINHIHIDNVEVTFSTSILSTNVNAFARTSKDIPFDSSYEHPLPETFQAYFVADETKGQYTTGEVVKVLTVNKGTNTIVIPKMKYDIYVTNYNKPNNEENKVNAWYTWSDAVNQMPMTSDSLYLLGDNVIDYSQVTAGSVQLQNPYSAVMVKNNKWVSGTPTSYDTQQEYTLVDNDSWYNLYIRANKTNTKVPISIPGNPNSNYTLNESIDPNKIYQYTINGNVQEGQGNLSIAVNPLEKGESKEIDL